MLTRNLKCLQVLQKINVSSSCFVSENFAGHNRNKKV